MIVVWWFTLFIAVAHTSQVRNTGRSIKATLIAEHSRKTHKDYRNVDQSVDSILLSAETAQQRAHRRGFEMASGQDSLEPVPLSESLKRHTTDKEEPPMESLPNNPFKLQNFDKAYKKHSLCEEWNSGRHHGNNVNLEYTESADRLLKIIGNGVVKNGYNMFMTPGQSQRVTTNVSVAVYFESMSSFRAQTMDFEVDMYLAMGWYDRRLAHNCTNPILVTHKFIADRIWQPDLYFVNSKFAYLQEVTTPNFMLIVYPDGLIFKSMRIDVTLSCMMDLKRFPTDKQECPMVIQSYAYVENLVNLFWHNDPPNFPIGSNAEIKLNDMVITNTRFEKCESPYPMFRGYGNWSCVRGFIVMKRLVLFHVIQTYAPTGMLVCISWMSFWLDPRASPARITLTITTLLTLTTMSNGARQDLPQVAYIKMLDLWLSFNQVLIFLVLLEYTIVSHFLTKRTMDCEHRRSQIAMGLMTEVGANMVFSKSQSNDRLRQRSKSPLPGITSPKPFCLNGTTDYIRQRHVPLDNDHAKLSAQNSSYSMSTGLGHCLGNLVTLCRLATTNNNNLYARQRSSWSDIEAETATLMSGTNHTNMPYYNKTDLTKPCSKCAYENEMVARKIDIYARIIFPATFATFCLTYWFYYSWWDVEK